MNLARRSLLLLLTVVLAAGIQNLASSSPVTRTVAAHRATCDAELSSPFRDVTESSAHGSAIACLAALDIVRGFADGTYGPQRPVTRAQLASILAHAARAAALPLPEHRQVDGFSDVTPEHAHAAAIHELAEAGIVHGYTDGTFRPGDRVTRAQAAGFLHRFGLHQAAVAPPFVDVDPNGPHAPAIGELAGAGILLGYPDGAFRPGASLSRGQMATLVDRLFGFTPEPAPEPPLAHDLDVSTAFETAVRITLSADVPRGGAPSFAVDRGPTAGSVVVEGDVATYAPDAGFHGMDSFTYVADDGSNASAPATVTITVEPAAPEAHDVAVSTGQDEPVVVTLDADNHSGNPLTYHYGQPDDGTVTGRGPDLTYTPDPGFSGTDTFTYHVNDGFNDSNTATVTVTVAFAAPDREFDAVGNTLLEVGVDATWHPSVEVAATLLDDAPAGFAVTGVDTSATNGDVEWNADGTFAYRPPVGIKGEDSFTYTVGDGDVAGSATVTVTIGDLVWYVDNRASGDGRAWSPFASLAEAEAASGPGDVIFVHEGEGAYTDGITLQDDQRLLGERAGLSVGGHDLVAPGDRPELAATIGDAVTLADDVDVHGLDVTGTPGRGLVAEDLDGTITVAEVDVAGVTGNAVHVDGGSPTITADVRVTNARGHAVRVRGVDDGSLQLSGAITDTGDGIELADNAGSTITFTGVLDVTTNGTPAFTATGGGSVTATASGSTLAATGAPGLRVTGTAVGDAGLVFASVSASDATHGIDLTDSGSGPLTVEGDGSADRNAAGGRITGMASHGVVLDGTGPVTLRNMDIEDNAANAIRARGVAGLTVVGASITGNSAGQDDATTRNSLHLREVSGAVRLEDSLVRDSAHNQIDVENTSGTVTIHVLRSTIRENGINSGLQVEARDDADVTLNVGDSLFASHHATAVHAFARNNAMLAVSVDRNTFEDNNVAVNLAAQHTAAMSSAVTGNTVSGHASHSLNMTVHEDALHETLVSDNDVDGSDTVASVGIRLVIEDDSTMRAQVEDNSVEGQTSGNGLRVLAREGAPDLSLVLEGNHVASTSASPAYSVEVLDGSSMCGAVADNTGTSGHPTRDMLVDLLDATASAQVEGLAVGPVTAAEFAAHLSARNPELRVAALAADDPPNVSGVANGTCQRPS